MFIPVCVYLGFLHQIILKLKTTGKSVLLILTCLSEKCCSVEQCAASPFYILICYSLIPTILLQYHHSVCVNSGSVAPCDQGCLCVVVVQCLSQHRVELRTAVHLSNVPVQHMDCADFTLNHVK